MELLPYQERVVKERDELSERTVKLQAFIGGPSWEGVNAEERNRLERQLRAMTAYLAVLDERIAAF